jgi:hypothetical protein
MTIDCLDIGYIPYDLNPQDQFRITMDISTWLDGDTIDSVAYSAVDDDGIDVSATVLDADQHSHTDTVLRPYVIGGADDAIVKIKMKVTTAGGDLKSFYINYICNEHAA